MSHGVNQSQNQQVYDMLHMINSCKDFQVEYMCDPKAKSHEIKQMHRIYRNARYMIAMIPEVCIYNSPEAFEQNFHVSKNKAQDWVIADASIVSIQLGYQQRETSFPVHYSTLEEQNKIRVVFAHFQTSTKPHDMIYALKNTFPYMFEDIEVGYSTDIKTVFNDFYRHVATEDISILCFGSNDLLDGRTEQVSTLKKRDSIAYVRVDGNWTDMDTADKETVLMDCVKSDYFSQIRPLTLTEDCKECIILPILLELHIPFYKHADGDIYNCILKSTRENYFLPALRECSEDTERYRAVGVYYIGDDSAWGEPTFKWNHSIGKDDIQTENPKEILNMLFENDVHDIPQEFIIE
ncbi:hypothetical protein BDC45DRAFT_597942 [Circinella umbellata]|nr:hypothetical protein BDC45DRAFT_597942 [Circinella umbellata]